ncbi:MAG: alpha/beta fold hydrolase [Rothia sp. (in: high G+C Gram-positive bacteria)]|nr:alpha/beta fold hydrolase [Rothia sp. (in: high G+C Gram-positive bacteria)]
MSTASLPTPSHRVGASQTIGNLKLIDHWFSLPLTHGLALSQGADAAASSPFASQSITVFAREVIDTSENLTTDEENRPYMVYLQGGPGGKSPRPATEGGWVAELAKTHRLILLDQRGTGNSTPLSARSITALGDAQTQAKYLELFRADSIVADAEAIRKILLADRKDQRWSTMGQSFGGFITLTYLSFAPEGVKDARMTAGLAPIRSHVDEVYRSTLDRMYERSQEYYSWYPQDKELAARIAEHLRRTEEYLPTGERLTDHRFQMLGNLLGGNGRARNLHYVLESAFAESDQWLSAQFLADVSAQVSFQGNPLYALLHETIYADGPAGGTSPSASPTNWSAARMFAERPDFSPQADTLLWTGEHIFPWYYTEDPALRPLAEVAELLATKDGWGPLYNHKQLAANEVPLAAAAYVPDVYVDYEHSMKTANFVGNTRVWTSPTHHHDGLGVDGTAILGHLKNLLADMG